VETRTAPRSSGGRAQTIDDLVVSTVKVRSDPAQVTVNHASFRVKLAHPPRPRWSARSVNEETAPLPIVPTTVRSSSGVLTRVGAPGTGPVGAGSRGHGAVTVGPAGAGGPGPAAPGGAPFPGGGRDVSDNPAATELLEAVRLGGTRLIPRIREDGDAYAAGPFAPAETSALARTSVIGPPRGPGPDDLLGRPFADGTPGDFGFGPEGDGAHADGDPGSRAGERGEPVHHARRPGRRRGSGGVLVPLRVFLGVICVYAGMGKLCDAVYFDGGERGSMVHWLSSLHPWAAAAPLLHLALAHPVGAGLTVAFLQIIVGMLSLLGLWQRAAAVGGMALSAALLLTVSWRTVPAYDAPDIIYLAAWSPLLIAGAPSHSLDNRLANQAWRRLGPRTTNYQLRRWALRRGAVIATVVIGLTLLLGSLLGGAVRAGTFRTHVPGPSDAPTNNLPGSPLPISGTPEDGRGSHETRPGRSPEPSADHPSPSQSPSRPSAAEPTAGGATGGGQGRPGGAVPGAGTVPRGQPPASTPRTHAPPPATSTGGSGGGGGAGQGSGSGGGTLGGILGAGDLLGMASGPFSRHM
jgi:uncharacterized membrane protein YphA (DoxX/SURF4 family)